MTSGPPLLWASSSSLYLRLFCASAMTFFPIAWSLDKTLKRKPWLAM